MRSASKKTDALAEKLAEERTKTMTDERFEKMVERLTEKRVNAFLGRFAAMLSQEDLIQLAQQSLAERFGALPADLVAALNVAPQDVVLGILGHYGVESLDQIRGRLGLTAD